MDELTPNDYMIRWFLVVCFVAVIIAFFVYARQWADQSFRKAALARLEKGSTLIKYIGVLIWYVGLIWLCLTNDALGLDLGYWETTIAVSLVASGVVLHLNGLKYEILLGLKSEQATG